ncbi:MAG: glycosyltransferase [Pseudomonadota bacterium]
MRWRRRSCAASTCRTAAPSIPRARSSPTCRAISNPIAGSTCSCARLPEILRRRPKAEVLIVGGDEVSYGRRLPPGQCYRQNLLAEVAVDPARVHFLGRISYDAFVGVLHASAVHVYLTYPFVLSWSMLEAMSCGCLVIGSATPPVQEVIRDRENGLLVDFFSTTAIADRIDEVLDHPDRMQTLRAAARQTIIERYDLRRGLPAASGRPDRAVGRRRAAARGHCRRGARAGTCRGAARLALVAR